LGSSFRWELLGLSRRSAGLRVEDLGCSPMTSPEYLMILGKPFTSVCVSDLIKSGVIPSLRRE